MPESGSGQESVCQGTEDVRTLLRCRSFVFFWFARVFSAVSFQIVAVAVGWQVYALTGSAFSLGMVGLVQFLPMVVLTLVAGQVADRCDRRTIVYVCQIVEGCAVAGLALGSFEGWLNASVVFGAVAAVGAARSFESPSMAALLPGLIPASLLPKAAALSSSAMQAAFIIGPAIGGFLYAAGPAVPYTVAAALFLSAAVLATLIGRTRIASSPESGGSRSIFSGIAFIRGQPVVLGAISLDLFAVLLGGATALLPIYARDILQTGPLGLGMLRASPAVGALCTSVVLARYPLLRGVGRDMFAAVIVFGLATLVFAVSTSMALSLGALFVLGAADVVSVVIRHTLVQLATPDHMRGRVSAVNFLFIGTSNQLGEFESGVTAAILGTVPSVVLGGVGVIAVALLWMYLFPQLRAVDNFDGVRP